MVNGVMGYQTYYNNNESLLRGVESVNEAKAVAKAQVPVKATTNASENTAANYSGFSKSSHFEGNVVGVANQLNMKNLSEDEKSRLSFIVSDFLNSVKNNICSPTMVFDEKGKLLIRILQCFQASKVSDHRMFTFAGLCPTPHKLL